MVEQIDYYDYERFCPISREIGFFKTMDEYAKFLKLNLMVIDSTSLKTIYNIKGERNSQIFNRLNDNYFSIFKLLYNKIDRNNLGNFDKLELRRGEYTNDYKIYFKAIFIEMDRILSEISEDNEIHDRKMISIFSLNFLTEEQKSYIVINDYFVEFLYLEEKCLLLHNVIQLIQVCEIYINALKISKKKDTYFLDRIYAIYYQIMTKLKSENILDNFFETTDEKNHIQVIISLLNSMYTAGINCFINKINEQISDQSLDIIRSVFMR